MIQRLQTFAWDGGYLLERLLDAVRWPVERLIWAVERGLVWPLEDRADGWRVPARAAGVFALGLLAVAAGVLGFLWASGGGTQRVSDASRPSAAPAVEQVATAPATAPAQVLHGGAPDFTAQPKQAAAGGLEADRPAGAEATAGAGGAQATTETVIGSSPGASASDSVAPSGPPAAKVANRFANAFVLYETGHVTAAVHRAFVATATPQLTRALLRRPPRLPAGVKVPRAKVVNVVPGPHRGDTYTMSVSLLRVGITSELRLEMQRDPKTGELQVEHAIG
jgi:hypothetical protein